LAYDKTNAETTSMLGKLTEESKMVYLKNTDLTNLGGPMGSEYTTTRYIKFFSKENRAKRFATKEHKAPIRWKRKRDGVITSGDLNYVEYEIGVIKDGGEMHA